MAFTSIGYDGTVLEGPWSRLSTQAGGVLYGVADEGSWVGNVVPNTDRRFSLTPGTGMGRGIVDISDTTEEVGPFDSQVTGVRYDLVVARRTWADNETVFAIVKGGSTEAIPARQFSYGVVDEQPLWLVPVVGNGASGVLGTPIDLRVFQGDSGAWAKHKLALTYMSRLGTQIRIGNDLWTRVLNGQNQPDWDRVGLRATPLLGVGQGLSGNPPAGADIYEQAGTAVVTLNAGGEARLDFPAAFPGGVLTVLLSNGDSSAQPGVTYELSGTSAAPTTRSYCHIRGITSSGAASSGGSARVNYIVKGW